MYWTRDIPSCSTRDECLWVVDQIGGDVPSEDISEQSLIDEKTYKFEASERDYSGGIYEWVPEFGQSDGQYWPIVWGWDVCPNAFEFFPIKLEDIGGFSQQFSNEWEVDYGYGHGCPIQWRGTKERDGYDKLEWVTSSNLIGKQEKRSRSRKRSSKGYWERTIEITV